MEIFWKKKSPAVETFFFFLNFTNLRSKKKKKKLPNPNQPQLPCPPENQLVHPLAINVNATHCSACIYISLRRNMKDYCCCFLYPIIAAINPPFCQLDFLFDLLNDLKRSRLLMSSFMWVCLCQSQLLCHGNSIFSPSFNFNTCSAAYAKPGSYFWNYSKDKSIITTATGSHFIFDR